MSRHIKAYQIDKHLKYNNKVNYNIYNVDQMAEKTNRIKSDNINNNNNNNKLSLIDELLLHMIILIIVK